MTQRPRRDARGRLLAALSALALVGLSCAPTTLRCPSPSPVPQIFKGVLFTGGRSNLPNPDPALAADTSSHEVVNLLYDGLVTLNSQQQVEPWGATRWDISPDGRTYTFHLRPGQSFTDGSPILASDYAFAINRALNPCLASPLASDLFALQDASTFNDETCQHGVISAAAGQTTPVLTTLLGDSILPNDPANTLTLILAQPAGYFLSALSTPAASALESSLIGSDITSEAWQAHLSDGPTGRGTSGMYYLAAWDHPTGKLVLKQNPHWWGRGQTTGPFLTEIDFTLFKDSATEYADYQAGASFAVAYLPASALSKVSSQRDYHTVPTLRTVYLLLDWTTPPFDNLDARIAFCLAVNRVALNQEVYGGAMLPTWHLVPQGMPGYTLHLIGPDNITAGMTDATTGDATMTDATHAQIHWQAYLATLHGKAPPPATFSYDAGSASQLRLARVLQQQWQASLNLNVAIAPTVVGPGVPLNAPPASFVQQVAIADWQDAYPDPQDVLSRLFLPESSSALDHTNVPQAIALLRLADAQNPSPDRLSLYQQAEALLLSQVAVCPLLQAVEHYQVRTNISFWSLSATGIPTNDTWRSTLIDAGLAMPCDPVR